MSSAKIIEEQAAELLARLDQDPGSVPLQAQVEQWVAADPRHEVAYLRLGAAWRQLDRAAALGTFENALRSLKAASPPSSWPSSPPWSASLRRWPYRAAALAASVALCVLGILWWVQAPPMHKIAFSTPVGGYARQLLADGSTVELNTQTVIEVDFDAQARRVRLVQGEARFHVSKDVHRPFLVSAGERRVRAVGTDFTVHMKPGQTEILVAEGRVGLELSVESENIKQPAATFLNAGQLALAAPRGILVADLPPAEVAARLAWDRGLLVFSHETLAKVAEELNRYNTLQIHVTDPAAAALQIGGTFSATSAAAFIHLLEEGFAVTVNKSADGVVVASR